MKRRILYTWTIQNHFNAITPIKQTQPPKNPWSIHTLFNWMNQTRCNNDVVERNEDQSVKKIIEPHKQEADSCAKSSISEL